MLPGVAVNNKPVAMAMIGWEVAITLKVLVHLLHSMRVAIYTIIRMWPVYI